MSTFSIHASCDDVALTLACVGELDVSGCGVLTDVVSAHEAAGARSVVLVLAQLTFIDSSGIATIVRLSQQLGERGVLLDLRSPTRPVRRAFEICGLLHLLERDPATAG